MVEEDVEGLIKRVVKESGKSRDDIEKSIADRKEKTHGLLSDYGAIYAVAKEYGIDLSQDGDDVTKIADVKPAKSLTVVGRVRDRYPVKEFPRKDGSTGKLASLILYDESGVVRTVFWDEQADAAQGIGSGDLVLIRNAYAKEGQQGVEVHVGGLAAVQVNPTHVDVDIPKTDEQEYAIKELSPDLPSASVHCRVNRYYPPSTFQRSDGSEGKRASFIAEDETGTIRVVLWDEAAETKLAEGDVVKVENGYVKPGLNNELELQLSSRGRVIPSERQLKLPEAPAPQRIDATIADVKEGMGSLHVVARIVTAYPPRAYSGGTMASLIVGDESGTMRVVLWNETSDQVDGLSRGDAVELTNAYAKSNFNDEVELHLGRYGKIEKTKAAKLPSAEKLSKALVTDKDIASLDANDRDIRITAEIADFDDERSPLYMTCPSCNKRAQNVGGQWFCEGCGDVDPTPNLMVSMVLEDTTGTIRAVAFRTVAEKVLGMAVEDALNLIGETQDEFAPLAEARDRLAGKKVSLTGRARYNDYADQLEFLVDDINEA